MSPAPLRRAPSTRAPSCREATVSPPVAWRSTVVGQVPASGVSWQERQISTRVPLAVSSTRRLRSARARASEKCGESATSLRLAGSRTTSTASGGQRARKNARFVSWCWSAATASQAWASGGPRSEARSPGRATRLRSGRNPRGCPPARGPQRRRRLGTGGRGGNHRRGRRAGEGRTHPDELPVDRVLRRHRGNPERIEPSLHLRGAEHAQRDQRAEGASRSEIGSNSPSVGRYQPQRTCGESRWPGSPPVLVGVHRGPAPCPDPEHTAGAGRAAVRTAP